MLIDFIFLFKAKCLGSIGIEMTPLDAAIESITKLESIVKTLFTERKTEDKVNASKKLSVHQELNS